MIEDRINISANSMSLYYFENYYRKHSKHPVRDSFYQSSFKPKYFKYFEKAAQMFCIRDGFHPDKFIKCCLADGFKYPAQIPLETNWNKYIKYNIADENPEKDLAESLFSGVMEIKKYGDINKLIHSPLIQSALFQNKIRFDPLILYFSKTFINFYNENIDKFNYNINFKIKRYPVFEYPRIDSKIRTILGNDYFNI